MRKALEYSFLSSYILKHSRLLTQVFENNSKAQEKLFKHMCNLGSREEWREGRRFVSSYIGVYTTKYQCRLLNISSLECIAGYIMEDAVGDRALKRMP